MKHPQPLDRSVSAVHRSPSFFRSVLARRCPARMFLPRYGKRSPEGHGVRWGLGVRVGRIVGFFALGLAFVLPAPAVQADELKQLHAQILRDPTNTDLNFRYAELAEQRGEIRKALVAYERVLINDPNNPEVHARLQRIRRMLQPDTTQYFVELGAGYESNPYRVATNERDDGTILFRLSMRDERGVGNGVRWRSLGQVAGDIYFDSSDLRYGFASLLTGPLVDLTPMIAMHAAVGGSAAYFDNQLYYKEATAQLTFESFIEGAYHAVRVRSGFRDYEVGLSSGDGVYVDVSGRFSFANVLGSGTNVSFLPWYRWSDMDGGAFSVLIPTEQVQPGRYREFGAGIEFSRRVLESVSFNTGIAVSQRRYANGFDLAAGLATSRRDVMIAPHATLTFHRVGSEQTDLRLRYRFEHNDSSVAVRDYENHIVSMTLVGRY